MLKRRLLVRSLPRSALNPSFVTIGQRALLIEGRACYATAKSSSAAKKARQELKVESKDQLYELIDKYAEQSPKRKRQALSDREKHEKLQFLEQIGDDEATMILSGERRIVSVEDDMKFSCTACGKCCRVGAHSVILDPFDLFRMSRSPSLVHYTKYFEQKRKRPAAAQPNPSSQSTTTQKRIKQGQEQHLMANDAEKEAAQLVDQFESEFDEIELDDEDRKPLQLTSPEEMEGTTTQLFALFPEAFNFELTRYPVKDDEDVIAPLCSLKPKPVVRPSSTNEDDDDEDEGFEEVCHFAYPAVKREGKLEAGADEFLSLPEYLQSHSLNNADLLGKLRCAWGGDYMPTTCATYPLSELWTTKLKQPQPQQQPQQPQKVKVVRKEFYALDVSNCEGVDREGAVKRTVGRFTRQQKLRGRVAEWEWFMNLSVATGKRRVEEKLLRADPSGRCADVYLSLLRGVWYDFDSLPLTEEEVREHHPELLQLQQQQQQPQESAVLSFEDEWAVVKATIERRTNNLCETVSGKCDWTLKGKKFQDSFQRVIEELAQKGIALRN